MIAKGDVRVMFPVPLVGALAYCLYGFTTTFEPIVRGTQLAWRTVYAGGCLACLLSLALLLAASIRADTKERVLRSSAVTRPPS